MLRQSQKKYSQPWLPWESRLAEETLGRLRHVPSEALRQHRSILQPEATHRDASTGDARFAVPQVWFSREEHGCVIVCLFVRPLACLLVCLFVCLFVCLLILLFCLSISAGPNKQQRGTRQGTEDADTTATAATTTTTS